MTTTEAAAFIGQEGDYSVVVAPTQPAIVFRVAVKDVRCAYGRVDLQIYPLAGKGDAWVSHGSVKLDKPRGKFVKSGV